jgi:hypothetical protein
MNKFKKMGLIYSGELIARIELLTDVLWRD